MDEMIYGDVNFAQGVVAILVIAGAKYATAWLSYASPRMNRILEGKPTPILRDGKLLERGSATSSCTSGKRSPGSGSTACATCGRSSSR